jgi:putative GTP pyrophosphokinase
LTQIQDIAGCRLVVTDVVEQDKVVQSLVGRFPHATIVDRREKPSHGYRAVHVIASYEDILVEIQVRTSLQHLWAELSEKLSDVIDPAIKYGGGGESRPWYLDQTAKFIASAEKAELAMKRLLAQGETVNAVAAEIDEVQDIVSLQKRDLFEFLRREIEGREG